MKDDPIQIRLQEKLRKSDADFFYSTQTLSYAFHGYDLVQADQLSDVPPILVPSTAL